MIVASLLLVSCSVDSCPSDEIRTDLYYDGYGQYQCVSSAAYESILRSHCMMEVRKYSVSLSDTWGNEEYNTEPVSIFADKVYFDCLTSMKNAN